MAFGTIYSYPNNPRVMKSLAAANFNNLEVTLSPFTMGQTNKTPDFLSSFPAGKVPAFEALDGSGTKLFESDAITQYIAENGPASQQLLGKDAAQRATIRQWVCYLDNEVNGPIIEVVMPMVGLRPYEEAIERLNLGRLERALAVLEGVFKGLEEKGGTWLAGSEEVSLADVGVVAALYWGFARVVDAEMRGRFPRVVEAYKRVMGVEQVGKAFGETKWCEKREVLKKE